MCESEFYRTFIMNKYKSEICVQFFKQVRNGLNVANVQPVLISCIRAVRTDQEPNRGSLVINFQFLKTHEDNYQESKLMKKASFGS